MDLGFAQAGFDIRVAVEFDNAACETLRSNWPQLKDRLLQERLEHIPTKRLLRVAGLRRGEVDVVFGGPPCQSWCVAGNRRGLDDPRGRTVVEFCRVVREAVPKMFCVENVPGFLNHSTHDVLMLIGDQVNLDSRWQYELSAQILNAAEYGLHQVRRRAFVVGWRVGGEFVFPAPSHNLAGRPARPWKKSTATVGTALKGLEPPLAPSPIARRVAQTIASRNQQWYGKA